jgi:hypothetical protein
MSGEWISIVGPPCRGAFAVSVASWAMAIAPTKDSPRPRVVVDAGAVRWLEGIEEAVDRFGRDHRPGVRGGDDGLSPSPWAEISTPAAGQAPASPPRPILAMRPRVPALDGS